MDFWQGICSIVNGRRDDLGDEEMINTKDNNAQNFFNAISECKVFMRSGFTVSRYVLD